MAIGVGIGLFAAGATLAGIGRAAQGQTAGQVVGGAVFSKLVQAGAVAGQALTMSRVALNAGISGAVAGGTRGLIMGGGTAVLNGRGAGETLREAGVGALIGGGFGFVGGFVGGASLYTFGAGFVSTTLSGALGGGAAGALGGGLQAAWRGDDILEGAVSGGLQGAAAGASMAMFAWTVGRATGWVRPLPRQPRHLPDPRTSADGRLMARTRTVGVVRQYPGMHHVKPLSLGGQDRTANLIPIPAGHNAKHPVGIYSHRYGTLYY